MTRVPRHSRDSPREALGRAGISYARVVTGAGIRRASAVCATGAGASRTAFKIPSYYSKIDFRIGGGSPLPLFSPGRERAGVLTKGSIQNHHFRESRVRSSRAQVEPVRGAPRERLSHSVTATSPSSGSLPPVSRVPASAPAFTNNRASSKEESVISTAFGHSHRIRSPRGVRTPFARLTATLALGALLLVALCVRVRWAGRTR